MSFWIQMPVLRTSYCDNKPKSKTAVANEVDGTPLEDAQIVYGGVTSMNADLKELSTTDFSRTMVIMIIGLFIVLTILFRSMIMPIYMIASLLLTYYTSISITEFNFCKRLRKRGCQLGSAILQTLSS
ncbi:MMPL family transporter [Bacillus subtilis]|uniref:MMPL family transporter n=1 Tax=Bacillus subtilis TaxID=1423 RepID=UPI003D1F1CBA